MKSLILAASVFALVGTTAIAAEVKKDTKAPVIVGKTMTDADMDKVTAGSYDVINNSGTVYDSRVNYHARNNGFQGRNGNAATCSGC